jgi:hypothetical protein
MNPFGIRGAAGYVVGQLDHIPRTELELIRLAQQRTPEGLYRGSHPTRYVYDDTVECPALRQLAREGKINHKRDDGPHYWVGRRYWL